MMDAVPTDAPFTRRESVDFESPMLMPTCDLEEKKSFSIQKKLIPFVILIILSYSKSRSIPSIQGQACGSDLLLGAKLIVENKLQICRVVP